MVSRPIFIPSASSQRGAHVSSFRTPSHSSSPPPSTLESPTSIYVTFKVLQLANTFRKRVTRKHTAQAPAKTASSRNTTADDFCQDFERQAFEEIDRYLGRKTRLPKSKRPTGPRDTASETCIGATKDVAACRSTDRLLRQLDQAVRFGTHPLDQVAKSNQLFVQQQANLSIDRLNVKELGGLLVIVRELLESSTTAEAASAASLERDESLVAGHELVVGDIDETYTENLRHLLLRLESELIRLLVARLGEIVQRHISQCQKDQSKHAEAWFFEFPDARHPLSTTWPWSIKPSLAVLWGVCWMFYDRLTGAPIQFDQEGNMVNAKGEVEVTADDVYAYLSHQQHSHRHQQQRQAQSIASCPRPARGVNRPSGDPRFPETEASAESMDAPPQGSRGGLRTSPSPSSHHHLAAHYARTPDQAPLTTSGLAIAHTSNSTAFATQPPPAYTAPACWQLPEDNFPNLAFTHDNAYGATAAVSGAWDQAIPVSYSLHAQQQQLLSQTRPVGFGGQAPLPPRSRHPSTPSIRVTTEFPQQYFIQQPQDYNTSYSATSISTNSSIPLHEATSYPNYQHQFHSGHLSPHSPYMADPVPEARELQTTTPPRSPQELQIGEPMTRKRSHSQMSNGLPFPHQDDSYHGSQIGEDELSPGRLQINRPDPAMNEQRKYMCNVALEECRDLLFDRKCEWSKHMDKHDRPYRCPDPGCAKLQGFTYSGGLLRHEREVHGKHGGPKAQLRCPHEDCKRHTGKGFTRKENLNEHVRRVHQGREAPFQQQDAVLTHDPALDALAGAAQALDDSADATVPRVSEAIMVDESLHSPAAKRRRQMPTAGASERSGSEGVDDLRRQIEHLQQENAQKDQRLFDMERTIAEMDRRFQEQQRAQNEWHEHQQQAKAAAAIATAAQQA